MIDYEGKAMKDMESSLRELHLRYKECDRDGHYSPNNPEPGICSHCFRHLEYESNAVAKILKKREGIPAIYQPQDAPVLAEIREGGIRSKKHQDLLNGWNELTRLFSDQY